MHHGAGQVKETAVFHVGEKIQAEGKSSVVVGCQGIHCSLEGFRGQVVG